MKKLTAPTEENRRNLKQKLMAALAMLMVAVILTVTVTYAWIILSIAPEVKGITTTIGANGSLEIALLNGETFSDPNSVTTATNLSLSQNVIKANEHWGNLVDLNAKEYGLQDIVLYPARLNVKQTVAGGGYQVDRNDSMLLVPTYGSDGRIEKLTDKTITGTYSENAFYSFVEPTYGVRAIGTGSAFSAQSSALSKANSTIRTNISGAVSAAKGSMYGFDTLITNFMLGKFAQDDIDTLRNAIDRLDDAVDYIDDSLRQGLIAVAASQIGDTDTFESARTLILGAEDLSTLLSDNRFDVSEMSAFAEWVALTKEMQDNLGAASARLGLIAESDVITKADIKAVLEHLMNLDMALINDKPVSEFTEDDALGLMGTEVVMLLKIGSGVYADIAEFANNYNNSMNIAGVAITIKTAAQAPYHLETLLTVVSSLSAADGGASAEDVKLEDIFGYSLDLAFRCNAYQSDLQLQTAGVQRIYSDSDSDATMGGGSYMEFTTANMDPLDAAALIDAVRVAFVDDAGNLLGVAKLNTSNHVINEENGNIMAPLYLYEFEIGTEEDNLGQLIVGERRRVNSAITTLDRNQAKAISTIVWLDGDIVDNTMVSAESHLSGILNLQFSSSADLLPADDTALHNYVADKNGLSDAIADAEKDYISKGQSDYTTVSWVNYCEAYDRAVAVENNPLASENLVYNTILMLNEAKSNLQKLDADVLKVAISDVREIIGKTDTIAKVVVGYDEVTGMPIYSDTYTEEQKDKGAIYAYDPAKNLPKEEEDEEEKVEDGAATVEEGETPDAEAPEEDPYKSDILKTPIYTEESWNNLADALYDAEALDMNPDVTPAQKDNAITRLKLAYDALDRAVYYIAYDYEGKIYYKAITDSADNYGVWCNSDFTIVISDMKILELDAYAVEAEIASISQEYWVSHYAEHLTPSVNFNDELYPELADQKFLGTYWTMPKSFEYAMTYAQYEELTALVQQARELYKGVDLTPEETLIKDATNEILGYDVIYSDEDVVHVPGTYAENLESAAHAADVITVLADKIAAKIKADEDKANEGKPTPPTANQLMVINKAISNAKSIDNYDEIGEGENKNTKMEALVDAVTAAEEAVNKADATYAVVDAALSSLNTQLRGYDSALVATEYNTITYSVPDRYRVSYILNQDLPAVLVNRTSAGVYRFAVNVITESGVLFETETSFEIYNKIDHIEICEELSSAGYGNKWLEEENDKGEKVKYAWKMLDSSSFTLDCAECQYGFHVYGAYYYKGEIVEVKNADGEVTGHAYDYVPDGDAGAWNETIRYDVSDREAESYVIFSTSDPEVLAWDGDNGFIAKNPGTVEIYLEVKTVQGNVYYAQWPYEVEVYYIPATGMSLTEGSIELEIDKSAYVGFRLSGKLEEGDKTYPHNECAARVVYSSSAPEVATVDGEGNIKAIAAGTARIKVEVTTNHYNTFTKTCTVTVPEPPAPETPEPETP